MEERCKFIPMRLDYEERLNLNLLNAALGVSQYTDKVDCIISNKKQTITQQIQQLCGFISGLLLASDYSGSII